MPADFLTDAQEQQYGRYVGEPTTAQLARFFYLDDTDRALIAQRRQDHTRLGFALQLCTVRFLGTFLNDPIDVPPSLVQYIAGQLHIDDLDSLMRYRDNSTQWAHANEIQHHYGYHPFTKQPEHFRFLRWLYTRAWLSAERPSVLDTGTRVVQSLSDPRLTLLPNGYGQRTLYRFNFADQHVLPRTLGVRQVATRLCFDSAVVTHGLALLQRVGAFRLINKLNPHSLARVLGDLRLGSDRFVIQVEALGIREQHSYSCRCTVTGQGEAHATGIVTAIIAESAFTTSQPSGVFHSEQLFRPTAIFRQCQQAGITVDLDVKRMPV